MEFAGKDDGDGKLEMLSKASVVQSMVPTLTTVHSFSWDVVFLAKWLGGSICLAVCIIDASWLRLVEKSLEQKE